MLGASFKGQVRPWWTYSFDLDRVERTEDNSTPAVLDRIPPTANSLPSSTSDSDFTRTHLGATSRFSLPKNFSIALHRRSPRKWEQRGISRWHDPRIVRHQPNFAAVERRAAILYFQAHSDRRVRIRQDGRLRRGNFAAPGRDLADERGRPEDQVQLGQGFQIAPFYALGNPVVGNPSLKPERSGSFDAGIEQPFARSRLTLSATYFRNNFEDLVDSARRLFIC